MRVENGMFPKKDDTVIYRKMPKGSLSESGYALNRTALEILALCDGKTSVGDIAGKIALKYDGPEEEIAADVRETLELLQEAKLVSV